MLDFIMPPVVQAAFYKLLSSVLTDWVIFTLFALIIANLAMAIIVTVVAFICDPPQHRLRLSYWWGDVKYQIFVVWMPMVTVSTLLIILFVYLVYG